MLPLKTVPLLNIILIREKIKWLQLRGRLMVRDLSKSLSHPQIFGFELNQLNISWVSEISRPYLLAAPLFCCTRGVSVPQRRCAGAACLPPASSPSAGSETEPRRARLPPTAGPPLAAVSPWRQTRPAAAPRRAAAGNSHLHGETGLSRRGRHAERVKTFWLCDETGQSSCCSFW